jgi:hypothetical protein
MVQVPFETKVTVLPVAEQIDALLVVTLTVSPEVADAVVWYVPPITLIAWGVEVTLIELGSEVDWACEL